MLPLVIDFEIGEPGFANHPYIVGIWVMGVALLMVSRIPTLSLSGIHVSQKFRLPLLAVIGIAAGATVDSPWATAIFVAVGYLASIPLLYWQRNKLRTKLGPQPEAPPADESNSTVTSFHR